MSNITGLYPLADVISRLPCSHETEVGKICITCRDQQLLFVKNEYRMLIMLASPPGKLADISKASLGRLQRINPREYNSWVPECVRNDGELSQLHLSLVQVMSRRAFHHHESVINSAPESTFKEWADALVDDGFQEAQNLYDEICKLTIQGEGGMAAGYKFQLYSHMKARHGYTLARIEPEYGLPNPATSRRPRGDDEQVIAASQDTQPNFYTVAHEQRKAIITDYKMGYKKEQLHGPGFWKQLAKYGGVSASTAGGGIENTQSTPPALNYNFYGMPPPYISENMEAQVHSIRAQNPNAFPAGLSLQSQPIVGASAASSHQAGAVPTAEQEASGIAGRINELLFAQGVLSQVDFGWADWSGNLNEWTINRIKTVRHWLDDDEIRWIAPGITDAQIEEIRADPAP